MPRLRATIEPPTHRALLVYLAAYLVFGLLTIGFYPSYAFPYGDEGTYLDYARHPWTLISEMFQGYGPKELVNPYSLRLFLAPQTNGQEAPLTSAEIVFI